MKTLATPVLALLILSAAGAGDVLSPPTTPASSELSSDLGSDLDKELRWRDQIVDSLFDGEVLDLFANGQSFLGIYTEAEDNTGRGALILHGIGAHPDWPQVVSPLRTSLPQRGWSTLSVQMPVLPNEADDADYVPLMDEVAPRIDAAIAYLGEHRIEQIAVVAHSLGATMANDYLASRPQATDAFVAIGLASGITHAGRDNERLLGMLRIPTLDLFGQNDLDTVVLGADARAKAATANPGYRQVRAVGANHFFDGREEALVEIISDWLNQQVPAPQ